MGLNGHDPAGEYLPPARPLASRRARAVTIASIALGGAIGSLARYALGRVVSVPSGTFPWATFTVNVTGCGAIGLALVVASQRFPRARLARRVVVTGVIGSYTTFSTFSVETDLLVRGGDLLTAALYLGASLFAGVLGVVLGAVLGRAVIRAEQHMARS